MLFTALTALRSASSLTSSASRVLGRILVASGCLAVLSLALAQPANEPLLERSSPVKPNLLYVLDDSGSMGGTFVESAQLIRATPGCGSNTVRRLAPINNLLHYNPAKRYIVGRTNTGDPQTSPVVDATNGVVTVYLPKATATALLTASNERSVLCDPTNFDVYEIKDNNKFYFNNVDLVALNPISTKSIARTDCAAASCSVGEERKNIANWYTFHRTRLLAAKTGSAEAFARVPTSFRLSYATINNGLGNFSVMRDYDLSRNAYMTWLNGIAAASQTPLRIALDNAGRFYSDATNSGPWGNTPWSPGSESAASHLSCRRSYTILITDGEWNGGTAPTAGARADVDGSTGEAIAHADGVKSYQYVPRSSDPRSRGKADNVSGAGYGDSLSDVSMYYWSRDLRTDLPNNVSSGNPSDPPFWQNMTTYTGAFGPVGRLSDAQIASAKAGATNWLSAAPVGNSNATIDDLIHAAHNGGGKFLTLTDADSFADELSNVIGSIADQQYSQAGVAASAVSLTAGTRKFVPNFNPTSWWGNVRAVNLKADGSEGSTAWEVVQTTAGKPTGVTTIPTPTTREIWVNKSSTATAQMIMFKYGDLAANSLISGSQTPTAIQTSSLMTKDIVDYIRGVRTNEGPLSTNFRPRDAILGDIVNSTPVFVKNFTSFNYSSLSSTGTAAIARGNWPTYATTKAAKAEGILLVGANDGMLHFFREGGSLPGEEILALIPRGVLGALHTLPNKPYSHRFFVDGPLSQHDAYINVPRQNASGTTLKWANIVAGSAGAGGRTVFALDASAGPSTNEKAMMWEVNSNQAGFANLGNLMHDVQMGVMQDGTWVAAFGNGPYGDDGRAYMFIVNLATGALLQSIATDTATDNGLGGIRLVRNSNGMIMGAYAGDLKGRMWRFNLGGNAGTWTADKLFTTGSPSTAAVQPITAAPAVFKSIEGRAGHMVIFGTGKLYDSLDQSTTSTQSAYGIWDNTAFGTAASEVTGRSLLVNVSTVGVTATATFGGSLNSDRPTILYDAVASRTVNWTIDRGWVIDYTLLPGQRTIFPVEASNDLVRVDTVAPRLTQVACTSGSSVGLNYIINPFTGSCSTAFPTFDTNNDGVFNAADSKACAYSTEADGRDVVLNRGDGTNAPGGLGGGGDNSCRKNLQNSEGYINYQDCKDPEEDPKGAGTKYRRDWRQLFPRQ